MLLRPSQHTVFLFFLQLVLLSFSPAVHAAPTRIRRSETTLVRRQDPSQQVSKPTTVTTVTHVNTPEGPSTERCQITLTPIKPNGQPLVQEVKLCTFTLDSGSSGQGTGGSSGSGSGNSSSGGTGSSLGSTNTIAASSAAASSSSDSSGTQTSSSASTTDSSSASTGSSSASTSSSSASSTSSSASATGSAASASGSASANPAVKVNGVSTVSAATPTAAPSSTSSSASATSSASASSSGSSSASGATGTSAADSASSSAAASSASAAAANASSQAAFTLPGKKLSVLPIGLGVFAGISVIALIVVGLVTYERTKYRKAFRQRKLAEAGQEMGYGGMAERTG